MSLIFISYRRDDAGYIASLLADKLADEFGRDAVFMDIDSVPFGVDFRAHIANAVGQSSVLLALIGDDWVDARSTDGTRRLDDPADFVRIEIHSAIERGIPVIPVLVGLATMPTEQQLPPPLSSIAFRNAAELRSGHNLAAHLHALVAALKVLLDKSEELNDNTTNRHTDKRQYPSRASALGRVFRDLFRVLVLWYWPDTLIARALHVCFYLGLLLPILFPGFVLLSVLTDVPRTHEKRLGDDFRILALLELCYFVPTYVLFWLPATIVRWIQDSRR